MPKAKGEFSGNGLLHSLSKTDQRLLARSFHWVDHEVDEVLQTPRLSASHIYFPVSAVYSASSGIEADAPEAGMIGKEGLIGLSICLSVTKPSFRVVAQTAGRSLRISEGDFLRAYSASDSLRKMVLRYTYAFLVQVAQTAIVNGTMTLQQRLARWLLMCQDRVSGPDLLFTNKALAELLGVRRAGVTVGLQVLENARAIKSSRGKVRITDRGKLKQIAGSAYGGSELEYQRIMGER